MFPNDGVWPVRVHRLHGPPVISDEFGRDKREGRGHLGVDIMFKRPSSGEENRPQQTRHFRMPNGTDAISPGAGKVWSVEHSRHGMVIRVDHGFPWLSVHRHIKSAHVSKGDRVAAGQALGVISFDPSNANGINHLHFELWNTSIGSVNSREARSVDPAPFMRNWVKLGDGEGTPGLIGGEHFTGNADVVSVDPGDGATVAIDFFSGGKIV